MARFRQQLQALGFSYDWDREVSTTSPEYYRWTQWIFLQLWKKGLAYQAEVPVNWCPALGTVLANEEVIDGKSERGGHPVLRVPMKQWMLRQDPPRFAGAQADGMLHPVAKRPPHSVSQDHRVRRPAARRPRGLGLVRVDQGDAEELDWQVGRG